MDALVPFLNWMISGVGSGTAVYNVLKKSTWFLGLDPDIKRYFAAGLSAVVSVGFWFLLAAGTQTLPTGNWWSWLGQIFGVAAGAYETSSLIQAKDLKGTTRVPVANVGN